MNTFPPGTKVKIKSLNKTGIIVYARMAPPNYNQPEAYSVKLDNVVHAGTIVSAKDCEEVK